MYIPHVTCTVGAAESGAEQKVLLVALMAVVPPGSPARVRSNSTALSSLGLLSAVLYSNSTALSSFGLLGAVLLSMERTRAGGPHASVISQYLTLALLCGTGPHLTVVGPAASPHFLLMHGTGRSSWF